MLKKTVLPLLLLLLPAAARCDWERVRSSDAPLAVVYASTGDYEVAYTVGENCASPYEMAYSSNSVWSGYLSFIPSSVVNQGFYGFDSAAGTTMEGTLWGAPPDEGVKLLFSTDISTSLSSPGITVTRVRDNSGNELNEPYTVATSYSGQRLVIVPSAAWPKGSVFSVYYSSAIVDINGMPLAEASTVFFSVVMDHAVDNAASPMADTRVRVRIPANAYSEDFFLTLSTDAARPEITVANAKLASMPGSPEFLNMVSIKPYDAHGAAVQPSSACVVTLPYSETYGYVDGAVSRMKASSLAIWLRDAKSGMWVKQTGAALDAASRTVSLRVPHFSDYALLGLPDTDLTTVYAYPVPFRPGAGDAARYGSWTTGIRFTNQPAYGTIKIYTITGELVRSLPVTPPVTSWDVRNSGGSVVASGVYLWEITTGSSRKTGKLVVIK